MCYKYFWKTFPDYHARKNHKTMLDRGLGIAGREDGGNGSNGSNRSNGEGDVGSEKTGSRWDTESQLLRLS